VVLFVPRSSWHVGEPTNNSGTTRPLLAKPVPTLTGHYTGAPWMLSASNWTAQQFMPHFQNIALSSGKSFEYNYVIPPRVDGSAQVWEYAGEYRAAHSENENHIAIGVLFAIGVNNHPSFKNYDPTKPVVWEPLQDNMIEAYWWLRDEFLPSQGLVSAPQQTQHRNMPGANTACPGVSIISRWSELSGPAPTPGDDMELHRKPPRIYVSNPAHKGASDATVDPLGSFGAGHVRKIKVPIGGFRQVRVQVTIVPIDPAGYARVGPGNESLSTHVHSNVNWGGGIPESSPVEVIVDGGDTFAVMTNARCDVIVDWLGWLV
jgi:hypothetical protein